MKHGWSQEKYIQAYRFAAERHVGQLVPGTQWSYLAHLSLVSMEVMGALAQETVDHGDLAVQAALLHDTIEDTDTRHDDLCAEFGRAVADGVQALTKDKSLDKAAQMQGSLGRIRKQPREIWMVKLADRITNLQPAPAHWDLEKMKAYQAEARLILDSLGDASPFLAQRLAMKIQGYDVYISAGDAAD
ncbi:MAG: HD domain-containing protein [Desulfobacterales bacterium]|nr:HD domain-containing protein [Desulfobacterales bacterium]